MNQEYKLYRISQLLSRFQEQVTILNSNSEFSINTHAENILIKVLNEVYNCNLKNVNYEEGKNYPSIDLRDTVGRIAVQVTATANLEKIKSTLSKFIENDLNKQFDSLYVFIITKKQAKYDQVKINKLLNSRYVFEVKNIVDRTDIYKELNSQNNLEKINRVCNLLEQQFADNKPEKDKWEIYCKGLHEYDQYITNRYTYLDIKGFSPKINNTLVKINLDNIYVPLELKLEPEFEIGANKKQEQKVIYSVENALDNFDNLVILGDPGSGKSTVLKHLVFNICSKRAIESQFDDYVPIIIKGSEFAKYVSSTSKQLAEYIINHFDKKYEDLFSKKLESNQLLILIDGIDEINITHLRHDVVDRINAFIAQYPKIKVVVSSRIVGYNETRLNGFFNHLQVIEFNGKQIEQFIKNWYYSISKHSDNDKELAKAKAKELYLSIEQNNSVLKMASNPLLVTIIALIHYQGSSLPEKRASLYDIATSTFLENWVKQRDSDKSSNFDKDTLIEILAPISFNIHQNSPTGLISESELKLQLIKEYKKINPYLKPNEEKKDIKEIIEFLREDAGFLFEKGLNENGEAMFGFVHQTFQEYFTAIEFKTRWRENEFENNLDEYVLNSNWIEVIKLTASLFKLNEPNRLGRQYTTRFIKDILTIKDGYPEIFRPLKVVVQILTEETEIEFETFIELIDKLFVEILTNDEHSKTNLFDYNREVSTFKYFLGFLIETKTYQTYLLERIIKEVKNVNCLPTLRYNLFQVLMNKSDNTAIQKELGKILKSNNAELKSLMFNYNTVMPVAEIVFTKGFRNAIVAYVNSNKFIESYKGQLPTQYHCCFEKTKKGDISSYVNGTNLSYEKIKEERLLSIKLIEDEKIRKDFINFHVFSIGISDVDILKDYVDDLKKEYPKIKLTKIETYISELEEFKAYGLNKFQSFEFLSTKIYMKKDDNQTFAFIKGKDVKFKKFPFLEDDLKPYFKKETKSYLDFLTLTIPMINDANVTFSFTDMNVLLNFIKYQNTIHWYSRLDYDVIVNYALNCLFDIENNANKTVLDWVKNNGEIRHKRFELDENFNKKEFLNKINSSRIQMHDKILLLHLVGEKSDYEHLIRPIIDSLKTEKSEKKKKEIKDILYRVL